MKKGAVLKGVKKKGGEVGGRSSCDEGVQDARPLGGCRQPVDTKNNFPGGGIKNHPKETIKKQGKG